MSTIRNVKLELLRSGPSHNQLLSPLVPYIALCGASGPVTVQLPFEHRQLLSRMERLRYATGTGEIPIEQRQFEARDIGEAIGRVLGQVPSLAPEIGKPRGNEQELVHLRLSVSALELALVPFELAIAPEGFPASGSPLFLQSRLPIAITREVRRGAPLPVSWNRKPRVLFAFAQPGGVAPVPASEHLNALRRAIDPWVKWQADEKKQVAEVKSVLTVLPDASVQAIRDECARNEYTHVHILAHGAPLPKGEMGFGLALCDRGDPSSINIVDGETLAMALTVTDAGASSGRRPTVVSLATCDSGQVGSVIAPGGSIAHDLNGAGIPWVIASQFPLWMRASTIAVDVLYRGLLSGEDPRWVLYKLRQQLRTDSAETHDWASIVAYATVPWNFERDLEAFRNFQVRMAIEVKFDKAEKQAADPSASSDQLDALYHSIRNELEKWCAQARGSASERSERLGMWAASEKRIGVLLAKREQAAPAKAANEKSRDLYRHALEADLVNHWAITQYLSMLAVLATPDDYDALADEHGRAWTAARQIAIWDSRRATGEKAAWALCTLAELEMLGAVFAGKSFNAEQAAGTVADLCRRICDTVGNDAFPVFSTRRQFQRYLDHWPRDVWNELAAVAVNSLGTGTSWVGHTYLPGGAV